MFETLMHTNVSLANLKCLALTAFGDPLSPEMPLDSTTLDRLGCKRQAPQVHNSFHALGEQGWVCKSAHRGSIQ